MENIDHSEWLRGSRPAPSGISYATRDLNDIPLRDQLPDVFTHLDTERILRQTKWANLSQVQRGCRADEEDEADKELRMQQPKQYVKKYHRMNMERAAKRTPAHVVSPHALTAMPPLMWYSIEGKKFTLKPHQLSGVGEMLYLESQEPYGGILADEMGLGKTVQIIALICQSLDGQGDDDDDDNEDDNDNKDDDHDFYDPQPTLIVTPKSLLPMWMEQLSFWAKSLLVTRYHGGSRKKYNDHHRFARYNIVVTTYGEVRSEYKEYKAINLAFQAQAKHEGHRDSMPELPPGNSRVLPLMTTSWYRIILEEAHEVRNTSIQSFKAVQFLQAQKRWAITGTPFMNDYTDLQSLLKFLRVKPWVSDHFFREHFIAKRGDRVTSRILEPIRNKVLVATFQSLAIRRERGSIFDGKAITDTQALNEINDELDLDDGTQFGSPAFYADHYLTEQQCQSRYERLWDKEGDYDSDVTDEELSPYKLYTFMLMAAIHYAAPRGGYSDETEDEQRQQMPDLTHEGGNQDADAAPTPDTTREKFKDHIRGLEHTWHSTKIDRCVSIIEERLKDVNSGKILVFCQYMTCLDILGVALEEKEVRYAYLHGRMALKERTKVVRDFQDEHDPLMPRVLLITSKCGSYGLTLTAASTVILLNNAWTPLNDDQCIARANRIGQKRVVTVYRLHMKRSIEDKKASIALVKRNKFSLLMTDARVVDRSLKGEDLRELLNFCNTGIGKVNLLGLKEPGDEDDDDGIV